MTDPWLIPVIETWTRVGSGEPDFVSRFHWRARRARRRLNAGRHAPFYRYEIVQLYDPGRRWAVVPFQNVARNL